MATHTIPNMSCNRIKLNQLNIKASQQLYSCQLVSSSVNCRCSLYFDTGYVLGFGLFYFFIVKPFIFELPSFHLILAEAGHATHLDLGYCSQNKRTYLDFLSQLQKHMN